MREQSSRDELEMHINSSWSFDFLSQSARPASTRVPVTDESRRQIAPISSRAFERRRGDLFSSSPSLSLFVTLVQLLPRERVSIKEKNDVAKSLAMLVSWKKRRDVSRRIVLGFEIVIFNGTLPITLTDCISF